MKKVGKNSTKDIRKNISKSKNITEVMTFHIITLFPGAFSSYINESIIKRAIEGKKIKIHFYNPRDFSVVKGSRVDDRPYGGGPGMVIQAIPVISAIKEAVKNIERNMARQKKSNKLNTSKKSNKPKFKIIFFAPKGKSLDTEYAKSTAEKYKDIIMVCGRYEGVDARIKKVFKMEDVSIGNYVVTGGELPAMIMMDTVSRQIEGVLGNFSSLEESRSAGHLVYTRPEIIIVDNKKIRVPNILISGNHKKIDEWRQKTRDESNIEKENKKINEKFHT